MGRSFCERAIELDPHWSVAFAWLAMSHFGNVANLWSEDPEQSIAAGLRAAERSVALDANEPMAQVAMQQMAQETSYVQAQVTNY